MTVLTSSHAGKNTCANHMLFERAGLLSHYASKAGSLTFCTQMANIHILFAPRVVFE